MKLKSSQKNALACCLAVITSSVVILRISRFGFSFYIPFAMQVGLVALAWLLVAAGYKFVLRKRGEAVADGSSLALALWQGVIRYFLALDLCMFGVQKFFHLQFVVPLGVLDNPFNTLRPDQLMWAFFGHFYAFTVIIACVEIEGALLLLFRKTRLIGVIFLMPVMLNILLLDYFYKPGLAVEIYITIEVVVLIYLLLIEYERLVVFFFVTDSGLPRFQLKANSWKNIMRVSVILIPLSLMAIFKFPQYYPGINGKYEVTSVLVNNVPQSTKPCRDSILTKIFIDKNDFVLEFNSYQRRFIGGYTYNEHSDKINVVWHYPADKHDDLTGEIRPGKTPGMKILTGRMGNQNLKIVMQRVDN